MRADYLAKGTGWLTYRKESPWDYRMVLLLPSPIRFFYEMFWAWTLYPRYEIIHSHFLLLIGSGFWEIRLLRLMGKKLVFHFRGCDIKTKAENLRLNPHYNTCQDCNYPQSWCDDFVKKRTRSLALKYGHQFFVTTLDLRDFVPQATWQPLVLPELPGEHRTPPRRHRRRAPDPFRIVHSTNHEGYDGTRYAVAAVQRLQNEGYAIEFIVAKKVPFAEVLEVYAQCDLMIGKLVMGFYANAQIEAMLLGVPVMSYIRDDFLVHIPDCPIINVTPATLYERLKYFLTHREELEEIGRRGPAYVRRVHDGKRVVADLIHIYQRIKVDEANG